MEEGPDGGEGGEELAISAVAVGAVGELYGEERDELFGVYGYREAEDGGAGDEAVEGIAELLGGWRWKLLVDEVFKDEFTLHLLPDIPDCMFINCLLEFRLGKSDEGVESVRRTCCCFGGDQVT